MSTAPTARSASGRSATECSCSRARRRRRRGSLPSWRGDSTTTRQNARCSGAPLLLRPAGSGNGRMVDPDIVARRLLALSDALRELERPAAGDPRALASDAVLRAAVERWLQVAIEACIDIANHIIASEGWPPP